MSGWVPLTELPQLVAAINALRAPPPPATPPIAAASAAADASAPPSSPRTLQRRQIVVAAVRLQHAAEFAKVDAPRPSTTVEVPDTPLDARRSRYVEEADAPMPPSPLAPMPEVVLHPQAPIRASSRADAAIAIQRVARQGSAGLVGVGEHRTRQHRLRKGIKRTGHAVQAAVRLTASAIPTSAGGDGGGDAGGGAADDAAPPIVGRRRHRSRV